MFPFDMGFVFPVVNYGNDCFCIKLHPSINSGRRQKISSIRVGSVENPFWVEL